MLSVNSKFLLQSDPAAAEFFSQEQSVASMKFPQIKCFLATIAAREKIKKRLPVCSGSHISKHLMKPANPFRFTGTPPASGLSGLPISPLRISIYTVTCCLSIG
jgi:hypothetical protein